MRSLPHQLTVLHSLQIQLFITITSQENALGNIFHICTSYGEDVLHLLLQTLDLYGQLQLKGQRATKEFLKKGESGRAKLDYPYSKLKVFRGEITELEIKFLLEEVVKKEKSLQEMESEIVRIKEMRALQNFFVKQTNSTKWEEVQRR